MSIKDVINAMADLKLEMESLSAELTTAKQDIIVLTSENSLLKTDIANIRTFTEHQANHIVELEVELDNMGQFNRRNNVVFTNIQLSSNVPAKTQIIKLCNEIGVNISENSFSSCHTLPSKTSNDKQIIARFKEPEIAKKIFKCRTGTKKISAPRKARLARDNKRGFGILPHLTGKRGKLFAQVKGFNAQYRFEGCWVDCNNGKIFLRQPNTEKGQEVKSTADLVRLRKDYKPDQWYFSTQPRPATVIAKPRTTASFSKAPLGLCPTCSANPTQTECSHCSREFCRDCTKQCDSCYETFCEPLCAVRNYDTSHVRSFCISCDSFANKSFYVG